MERWGGCTGQLAGGKADPETAVEREGGGLGSVRGRTEQLGMADAGLALRDAGLALRGVGLQEGKRSGGPDTSLCWTVPTVWFLTVKDRHATHTFGQVLLHVFNIPGLWTWLWDPLGASQTPWLTGSWRNIYSGNTLLAVSLGCYFHPEWGQESGEIQVGSGGRKSGGQWKGTCLWRKEQDPRRGTSLVVQWLRPLLPMPGGQSSIPGRGTRTHVPQLGPSTAKQINI